jgi:uncharacterized surface protein with fasciclin (FAS1) repeats
MLGNLRFLLVATTLIGSFLAASFAHSENAKGNAAAKSGDDDIFESTVHSKHHTKLSDALRAAGMADAMQGDRPITIFAPTDEAFAEHQSDVDSLMKLENKDKLTKFLNCHMVPAKLTTHDMYIVIRAIGGSRQLTTVGGCKLLLSLENGKIVIRDEQGRAAIVTGINETSSNGMIQTIDRVLQLRN